MWGGCGGVGVAVRLLRLLLGLLSSSALPSWRLAIIYFFFKTPCVRSSRSVRLRIRVVELLVLVEAVVVADVVEAAVGAVLVAQRRQAVEGGALGGAGGGGGGGGGVVVHGTEGQGGGRRGAGGHRHHGGQDEGQAVGHVFVGGASQGRSVT